MSAVRGLKDSVVGFFAGAGSWLLSAGSAIIDGLASGISGAIGKATSAISGVVSAVRDFLPFSPAKKGPFSGHGYTTFSGEALVTDFGKSIMDTLATQEAGIASELGKFSTMFGQVALPPISAKLLPPDDASVQGVLGILDKARQTTDQATVGVGSSVTNMYDISVSVDLKDLQAVLWLFRTTVGSSIVFVHTSLLLKETQKYLCLKVRTPNTKRIKRCASVMKALNESDTKS
jgi:phage-related protein